MLKMPGPGSRDLPVCRARRGFGSAVLALDTECWPSLGSQDFTVVGVEGFRDLMMKDDSG